MGRFSIVAGVDLGSSTFRVYAGVFDRAGRLKRSALGRARSQGVSRGMVTDLGAASRSLMRARDAAAEQLGWAIQSAWVGVSGGRVASCRAEGRVSVVGQGHEIGELDMQRALIAAEIQSVAQEREALHVIPTAYAVDGHWGVQDPIGMFGHELWVRAEVMTSDLVHTQNLLRAVRQANLKVEGLVVTSLAAASSILTLSEKLQGVVFIDIGFDCTDVIAIREGHPVVSFTVPIAGSLFDRDLSYGLRVAPDQAEQMRKAGGVEAHDGAALMTMIIRARAEEVFEYVLSGLGRFRAHSAVLTGGLSRSVGIREAAERVLGIPCRVTDPRAELDVEVDVADLAAWSIFRWACAQKAWPAESSGWFDSLCFKLQSAMRKSREKTPH